MSSFVAVSSSGTMRGYAFTPSAARCSSKRAPTEHELSETAAERFVAVAKGEIIFTRRGG